MRLYRRAGWTCAHATRPQQSCDRVLAIGVSTPRSRLSREPDQIALAGKEGKWNVREAPLIGRDKPITADDRPHVD